MYGATSQPVFGARASSPYLYTPFYRLLILSCAYFCSASYFADQSFTKGLADPVSQAVLTPARPFAIVWCCTPPFLSISKVRPKASFNVRDLPLVPTPSPSYCPTSFKKLRIVLHIFTPFFLASAASAFFLFHKSCISLIKSFNFVGF